jgi:hypothetical protein
VPKPANGTPLKIHKNMRGINEAKESDDREIPKIVKNAPFLHRENSLSLLKDKLLDKFYYRYREFYLKEESNPVKTTKK